MKIPLFLWLFLIPVFLNLSANFAFVLFSGRCLDDQQSLLLQLKDGLEFESYISSKLVNWNVSIDCCKWDGVKCDTSGRVISLELDGESISSGIENSTSLFKLQYLQKLNLAYNSFSSIQIPSGISNLKNLVHLNLSEAGFVGQIPIELSNLSKLVSLDLSNQFFGSHPLKLENPSLTTLVQNLQNLEELYLDGVDISSHRSNWSQVLASSVPRLTILSLRKCQISGPIDTSLSKLRFLSVIQLDKNNLSTAVPDFFADFPNLRTLSLALCNLQGTFPDTIFQVQTLQYLDVSYNYVLHGSLHRFSQNSSLRTLVITYTKCSGSIPSSIGNLCNLSRIDLSNCNFSGPIPPEIKNLSELVYLDFSSNSFSGPLPSFYNSKNISFINLSRNRLTGSLSPAHFEGLSNLVHLNLGYNLLTGSLPSSILTHSSLSQLVLAYNQLSGRIHELSNASTSLLQRVDLSANRFNGSIPKSFFKLRKLSVLELSSNSFTGTIHLDTIKDLLNLTRLDLSYNNIVVDPIIDNLTLSRLPQLSVLKLASCKLKTFPNLVYQYNIVELDLSDNQIKGEVPNWIWEVGHDWIINVNLSSNFLVSFQKPYNLPNLSILDLHSNHLQGEIPIPPSSVYVDYSRNNFSNSIPPYIGHNLYSTNFFSLAHNSLTGSIPASLCNATSLLIIDFSDNFLTSKIPSCLLGNISSLGVVNLARNNLTGYIPDNFPLNSRLKTLDLSSNALEGKIPGSLFNCTDLEVLNIGNNKLEDVFPCHLKNLSSLRLLVLRSNKFYGDVICHGANNFWPELQIIDIASNKFNGVQPRRYFSGWRRMMLETDTEEE